MLSELVFIREILSKPTVSLPTRYLKPFRGYSELIKIVEKSRELSEMNKNRRNSRL